MSKNRRHRVSEKQAWYILLQCRAGPLEQRSPHGVSQSRRTRPRRRPFAPHRCGADRIFPPRIAWKCIPAREVWKQGNRRNTYSFHEFSYLGTGQSIVTRVLGQRSRAWTALRCPSQLAVSLIPFHAGADSSFKFTGLSDTLGDHGGTIRLRSGAKRSKGATKAPWLWSANVSKKQRIQCIGAPLGNAGFEQHGLPRIAGSGSYHSRLHNPGGKST